MNTINLRHHTGIFGLVASVISLMQLPLYFMYPDAPPQWNVLTRILVSIIGSSILIVFLTGFRLVICEASPRMEWASTVVLVSGLMWLTFSLVAQSMEAGTAITSKIPIDPTIQGPLAPGQFLLFGSIGRAMTTLFLGASALAILRGHLMPAGLAEQPGFSRRSTWHSFQQCSSAPMQVSSTAPSDGERPQPFPSLSFAGSFWGASF